MSTLFGRTLNSPVSRTVVAALISTISSHPAICGPIHEAAEAGDVAQIQALLKANPRLISSRNRAGLTPLHLAAYAGQKEVVELLLADKADVNIRALPPLSSLPKQIAAGGEVALRLSVPILQLTPLHYAAMEGHAEVVQLLLANQADVNARDSTGSTALHYAAFRDHGEIVELLLAKGAQVDARDNEGMTPLHEAAIFDNTAVAELLLSGGANVNAINKKGKTPLHVKLDSLFENGMAEALRQHGGH
jgi:ankyrin repeat protein